MPVLEAQVVGSGQTIGPVGCASPENTQTASGGRANNVPPGQVQTRPSDRGDGRSSFSASKPVTATACFRLSGSRAAATISNTGPEAWKSTPASRNSRLKNTSHRLLRWVRLGAADLFFFVTAAAREEEKAWNRVCPCQDGCALIEEIRRHELDNECQSVRELGALGAGCACSHSLSVYRSYSVENEGPLGGDYRNLAGRRRRVHRVRHAYAVCRPLGSVRSAVRSFSSLLDRNHCPFHIQHVREDRTV